MAIQITCETAGKLATYIKAADKKTVTVLQLSGNINAIDIRFLRDELPCLSYLDLSDVRITAYQGNNGTSGSTVYFENDMPENSFFDGSFGKESLIQVILPKTLVSISKLAFAFCKNIKSFIIPATVTSISTTAFYNCNDIENYDVEHGNLNYLSDQGVLFNNDKTILIKFPAKKAGKYVIPSSIKTINDMAFYLCSELDDVVIPNSVTKILYKSFYGCYKLSKIEIPNSVTYIGEASFMFCNNVENIRLSENINRIQSYSFAECKKLKEINIPLNIKKIEKYAFSDCCSIESDIIIPDNVDTIDDGVFNQCSNINKIVLPKNIRKLGAGAFGFCSELKEINIPEIGELSPYLFRGCTTLNRVNFSQKVKKIGSYCFSNCVNLMLSSLPDSINYIGDCAFEYCNSITQINLPQKLKYLGSWAFKSNNNLEVIYSDVEDPSLVSNFINLFDNDILYNCELFVPKTSYNLYVLKPYRWDLFKKISEY